MTENAVAAPMTDAEILENVVVAGDLAQLKPETRVLYYREVCKSLGLNPLTKPFAYIVLNGKLTLYATKTATDQLRAIRGISIDRIDQAEVADLYTVTVYGHDKSGRTDSEVGVVSIANLKGENRANAIMKAITKAKRRLTLSSAGLGWLDDSEVGSVTDAQPVEVDTETGEVLTAPPLRDTLAARRAAITSGSPAGGSAAPVGQEEGGPGSPPGTDDSPPPAASSAGARTATPDPVPGNAEAGNPEPAPGPEGPPFPSGPGSTRCEGFHPELGACVRKPDHEGNHSSKDRQTWR